MPNEHELSLDETIRSLPPTHRAVKEYERLLERSTVLDRLISNVAEFLQRSKPGQHPDKW